MVAEDAGSGTQRPRSHHGIPITTFFVLNILFIEEVSVAREMEAFLRLLSTSAVVEHQTRGQHYHMLGQLNPQLLELLDEHFIDVHCPVTGMSTMSYLCKYANKK